MPTQYDSNDAAKDTDTPSKEVDRAWHDARTDDQRDNNPTVDYGDRDATYVDPYGNDVTDLE